MTDAKWPPVEDKFDNYITGYGLDPWQAKPHKFMKDMGHHPYLSQQPNGYSDKAEDWMSPELIIRRLLYARQGYINLKPDNKNDEFFKIVVEKNFDNSDKIMRWFEDGKNNFDRDILNEELFNAYKDQELKNLLKFRSDNLTSRVDNLENYLQALNNVVLLISSEYKKLD